MRYFIGLDISKLSVDACFLEEGERTYRCYKNNYEGHTQLLESLDSKEKSLIVCEPTGGYEKKIVERLQQQGYPVHLVNTVSFANFSKSIHTCKTDRLDAYKLALYGQKFHPKERFNLWNEDLKTLQQRREDLVRMLADEKRRQEHACGDILLNLQDHIKVLEKMIMDLSEKIQKIIDQEASLKEVEKILVSIPGIGNCLASKLLSHLPELGHTSFTVNELAALVGIAPYARDSGQKSGHRFIQGGRKIPRDCLYIAVLTGRKSIPFINDLYERLCAKGKPKKKAIVACMRKFLVLLHALVKQKRTFQKVYQS